MSKDVKVLKELVRLANRTEGWSCVDQGRRWRFVGPDSLYFASKTPGGNRALSNIRADLRKRGLPC